MVRRMERLGFRITLFLLLITLFPWDLMAAEVGRFTQVEGQVELYKAQKPKPIPAQPQVAVETNDRIKTEALSRAQLQFLDASTLTVAPLSDVIIEPYMFDKKKGMEGGLFQVTRGLVHFIVQPLVALQKTEFLIKTPTAIMGIRGTEFYVLIGPDFTDVFVKTGSVSFSSKPAGSTKISVPKEEETAYEKQLRRAVDIRAAKAGSHGGNIMVGAMTAGRAYGNRPAFISGQLNEEHFNILRCVMNTGLPANLQGFANSIEMLKDIERLCLPLGGTPLGYTPPDPPPAPAGVGPTFPGGGGGGAGGGVASPSS